MLVLTEAEIRALLDLDALVDAVAGAMADASAGRASMPQRIAALVPDRSGMLAAMPAYLPSAGALTVKLVSLFPQNAGIGIPTPQAVIAAFDPGTGTPAGLTLATRLLARPAAAVLAT